MESFVPRLELHDPFGTELHERAARLVKGLFTVEFSLGEKLVGITDNLLFEGLGLQPRKPSARVACAYPPYAKRIVNGNGNVNCELLNKGSPYHPVPDVGLGAVAVYAGRITTYDADVVEHGGSIYKVAVEPPLGVGIDDAGSLVGYRLAVDHEDVAQLGHLSLGVVMVYYRLIVYH